jgi:hypothetical protein
MTIQPYNDHSNPDKRKYAQVKQQHVVKHRQHVYNGFPHFSSSTGACMCFSSCCLDSSGCICRSCSGADHVNCTERRAAMQRHRARVKAARDELIKQHEQHEQHERKLSLSCSRVMALFTLAITLLLVILRFVLAILRFVLAILRFVLAILRLRLSNTSVKRECINIQVIPLTSK